MAEEEIKENKNEKVKKKDDAKLLKCPFSLIKDECLAEGCMSWRFAGSYIYGYCGLISDE